MSSNDPLPFHRCHGNRSDFLDIYQLQGKSLCSLMWELQNCFSPATPPPSRIRRLRCILNRTRETLARLYFSLLLKLRLWDTTLVLSSQTITSQSYVLRVVPVLSERGLFDLFTVVVKLSASKFSLGFYYFHLHAMQRLLQETASHSLFGVQYPKLVGAF
jgi:hypothetical protein